jgi:hypothetical protein
MIATPVGRLRVLCVIGAMLAGGYAVLHACDYPDPLGGLGVYPGQDLTYAVGGFADPGCVTSGADAWTSANSGGSGVSFSETSSNQKVTISHADLSAGDHDNMIVLGDSENFRDSDGYVTGALVHVDDRVTDCAAISKVVEHELGHVQGLADEDYQDGGTVMNQMSDSSDSQNWIAGSPTFCDLDEADYASFYQCDSGLWYPSCPEDWTWDDIGCCYDDNPPPDFLLLTPDGSSPVLGQDTVNYNAGGSRYRAISWPAAPRPGTSTMTGLLGLDRNGNATIDDGRELFGPFTPQRGPRCRWNGLLALIELDQVQDGGNSDGVLDQADDAFRRLVVWFDYNRNGQVDLSYHELIPLTTLGFVRIDVSGAGKRSGSASAAAGTVTAIRADGTQVKIVSLIHAQRN